MGKQPSSGRSTASKARLGAFVLALSVGAAQAQLNLGSQDVPRENIDGYLNPLYRVVAAGLGAGRLSAESGSGWNAGLEACLVPLPDGEPFRKVSLSALPLFRALAGARFRGAGAQIRGMGWRDPRMGALAAYGAGLA